MGMISSSLVFLINLYFQKTNYTFFCLPPILGLINDIYILGFNHMFNLQNIYNDIL